MVKENSLSMDAETTNVTEAEILLNNRSILAQCLQILQLTTASPMDNPEDFANLTFQNDSLSYCLQNVRKYPSPTQPYILPLWQQILLAVFFGIMVKVAVLGNSIVIWIVLAHRRMRTVTNFFLVNLSVTDLMMAIFNTIFSFIFMLSSDWPFGGPYCTFSNFVGTLSVASSVFTITAISVDRYVAIVRPLTPRISRKAAVGVIAIIWILGSILSLPHLLYSTVRTYKYPDGTKRTICFLRWPDGRISGESGQDYAYNIVIILTTYVVPLSSIIVTYSWMVHVLWKSKGIGEVTQTQRSAIKAKQRVARMLTVVSLLFAVCWLPYHVYFLYAYHDQDAIKSPKTYVQQIYLAIYWLAMSNSMYNPIVYYWMNSRFRSYFRMVLCCCCVKGKFNRFRRRSGFLSALRSMRGSAFSTDWSQKTALTKAESAKSANQMMTTNGVQQRKPSQNVGNKPEENVFGVSAV